MMQTETMGRTYAEITPELRGFIERQRMFFTASAPSGSDGHVNCSPKGLDSLAILGPRRVAYLDLVGSGAETLAHVRQNGRLLLMFCAFEGPPKIVRLHGRAVVRMPSEADYEELSRRFEVEGARRCVIDLEVTRVSDACGYGVPLMEFQAERPQIADWARAKGPAGVEEYIAMKNAISIDGLPAVDPA